MTATADHIRVLKSGKTPAQPVVRLMARGETRYLTQGDYSLTFNGITYTSEYGMEISQLSDSQGLGSLEYQLTLNIARLPWFRDVAGNAYYRTVRAVLGLSLIHI